MDVAVKFKEAGGIPTILSIQNDTDFSKASDAYAFLKKYYDYSEKRRKEDVAHLIEQKREIDDYYKEFTNPLEVQMKKIKQQMTVYSVEQQTAQRLLEAEAIASAVVSGEDSVVVDDLSVTKNQSEFSSSSLGTTTKFRFKYFKLNEVLEIPTSKFKT